MKKSFFIPILTFIVLNVICYIFYRLTWMGPEGGILLSVLPDSWTKSVTVISVVIQVLVLITYFKTGQKMHKYPGVGLSGIWSVAVLNILCVIAISIFETSIVKAVKLFSIFGNSSFVIMSLLTNFDFVWNIIALLMPSIFMNMGYVINRKKRNVPDFAHFN